MASRLPCAGCGRVKPPGRGLYCRRCKDRRNAPRTCERCSNPPRSKHAKLCVECKAKAREADRAYQAQWHLEHPDRPQQGSTSYADTQRMRGRLLRERDGHELTPAPPILRADGDTTRADAECFPHLPSGPLAVAVDRLIQRESVGLYSKGTDLVFTYNGQRQNPITAAREDAPSVTEAICERLEITSKTLREWRDGRRPTVRFDAADRVVTRAGWLWWDVWTDGEGYRLAAFAFEGEARDVA